jgi:hypothetical protein
VSTTLDDYRVARHAEELALEAVALTRLPGADRDASRFYGQTGDGGGGRQPLTLKRWMVQTAPQKPSPDDWASVERSEVARLQDAHAVAESLWSSITRRARNAPRLRRS